MRTCLVLVGLLAPSLLAAQAPAALEAERADYSSWLQTAPSSPYAAVLHEALVDDLVFGPDGRAALVEAPVATLSQGRLGLALRTEDGRRSVPRNRDVPLGDWLLRVSGPRSINMVTVYAPLAEPVHHPHQL